MNKYLRHTSPNRHVKDSHKTADAPSLGKLLLQDYRNRPPKSDQPNDLVSFNFNLFQTNFEDRYNPF